MSDPAPKLFFSHSSLDKAIVRPLAEELRANGVDVWFDEWEMGPGDSLVQKISDGLAACDVFLVAISRNSLDSQWVREELSSAVIRRIEEQTRLIPLRLDDAPLPAVINHLFYVRIPPPDQALRDLLKAIFGISDKPPIGTVPAFVREGIERRDATIAGLSPEATALLREVVRQARHQEVPFWAYLSVDDLQLRIGLDDTDMADAIDVLRERGLLRAEREGGMTSLIRPHPRAWSYVAEDLGYDLRGAMLRVARAVVAHNEISGPDLERETELPIEQLQTAAFVLKALRLVEMFGEGLGAGRPYGFVHVSATRRTREWVRQQASR